MLATTTVNHLILRTPTFRIISSITIIITHILYRCKVWRMPPLLPPLPTIIITTTITITIRSVCIITPTWRIVQRFQQHLAAVICIFNNITNCPPDNRLTLNTTNINSNSSNTNCNIHIITNNIIYSSSNKLVLVPIKLYRDSCMLLPITV